jgi:hypothetical protein
MVTTAIFLKWHISSDENQTAFDLLGFLWWLICAIRVVALRPRQELTSSNGGGAVRDLRHITAGENTLIRTPEN